MTPCRMSIIKYLTKKEKQIVTDKNFVLNQRKKEQIEKTNKNKHHLVFFLLSTIGWFKKQQKCTYQSFNVIMSSTETSAVVSDDKLESELEQPIVLRPQRPPPPIPTEPFTPIESPTISSECIFKLFICLFLISNSSRDYTVTSGNT